MIASGGDQEDVPEASGRGMLGRASLLKRRNSWDGIETGGPSYAPRDEPGGCPCIGQVVPGVEAA